MNQKIRYYKYINIIQLFLQINSNSCGEVFGLIPIEEM